MGIDEIIQITEETEIETHEIVENLNRELKSLTYSQLLLVEKFIQEIIPYTK